MLRARFIKAAGTFHRGEEAQMSFLAIAGFICFVALLAMVINTSDMVTERVRLQDAADMSALSAAAWSARGLNLVSFINVLNSKLISTAVLINALRDALPIIRDSKWPPGGRVQLGLAIACGKFPPTAAFCAGWEVQVRYLLNSLKLLQPYVESFADSVSKCPTGVLWVMMNTLNTVAGGVQKTFGGIALAEGIDIAKANGAKGGAVSGELLSAGIVLPLEQKKNGFKAFCPKIKNGGPGYVMQGYNCGEGPLELGKNNSRLVLALYVTLFSFQAYDKTVKGNYKKIGCPNGTNSGACSADKKPNPWVLKTGTSKKDRENFQNRLRFISVVYKDLDKDPPFWSTFFDSPPKRVMAYGQAQVYNYLSEDTFTQDWRVRLERASLLGDYLKNFPVPGMNKALGPLDAVNNH